MKQSQAAGCRFGKERAYEISAQKRKWSDRKTFYQGCVENKFGTVINANYSLARANVNAAQHL
jgi:hypothetical protein